MSFFAPSAPTNYVKFTNPGDSVAGYVEEVGAPYPVTEYKTDKPKLDSKGNPVMQVRVILATDQSAGQGDDGRRSLFVSGWRMTTAIGDAMRRANEAADEPQPGAFLKLTFARLGQSSGGMAPPKVYVAEYTKPPHASTSVAPPAPAPAAAAPAPNAGWMPPQNTPPAPW
ncbi:hypothetical protein EES41_23360 [Streptomyces sp. ADI95-16]|uniref:hypothetical protein n=1 Tax=Streptomyces sp. ADI95-16 TaxID=1522758 RepID=UPI000F3A8F89|nr:hypothetical protein [Streptomyces sp. ADI95-16]AYV29658.1 hypothetical protein EES41_23360 [Streptomyces sp. ADI95-16]